jgi:hypothetical protein
MLAVLTRRYEHRNLARWCWVAGWSLLIATVTLLAAVVVQIAALALAPATATAAPNSVTAYADQALHRSHRKVMPRRRSAGQPHSRASGSKRCPWGQSRS